jgi:uncharacterized protein (UPF0212 family)
MSREAVSVSVPEILQAANRECLNVLVEVRFGSWETISCPHCGKVGKALPATTGKTLEMRWLR